MTTWWQKDKNMPKYVTQEHFDASLAGVMNRFDGLQSEVRREVRDLVTEIREGFRRADERFNVLESKTDAIMQLLVTRQEMHNLTRELRHPGVPVDDKKVFLS